MDIKFPPEACAKREQTSISCKCIFVLPSVEAVKTGDTSKHMECRDLFFEASADCVDKGDDFYTVRMNVDPVYLYTAAEYAYPLRSAMFVRPFETNVKAVLSASNYVRENYRSAEVRIVAKSQETVTVHIPKSRFIEIGRDFGEVCVTDPREDSHTFFYCDKAHIKKTRGGYDISLPSDSVLMLFLSTHTDEESNIRETDPIKVKDMAAICEKRKRGAK